MQGGGCCGPWAGEVGRAVAAWCCPSWLSVPSTVPRFQPDHPLMASALLQLKGDVKETYKVFFIAQVTINP